MMQGNSIWYDYEKEWDDYPMRYTPTHTKARASHSFAWIVNRKYSRVSWYAPS